MSGRDWRRFGRLHSRLYKRLGGRFVGSVGLGRTILLLTSTGRKTGLPRTTPLVYLALGEQLIIYPSNGGREAPPSWWLNLQANPEATVLIGKETSRVAARSASEEEHVELWPEAERYNPHWRNYARTVTRPIPLVLLEGHSPRS